MVMVEISSLVQRTFGRMQSRQSVAVVPDLSWRAGGRSGSDKFGGIAMPASPGSMASFGTARRRVAPPRSSGSTPTRARSSKRCRCRPESSCRGWSRTAASGSIAVGRAAAGWGRSAGPNVA